MKTARVIRTVTAAAMATVLGSAVWAAPSVTCDVLLRDAAKRGEKPAGTLDKWWGIVSLETKSATCREPLEVWKRRGRPDIRLKTVSKAKKLPSPAAPAPMRAPVAKPVPQPQPVPQAKRRSDPDARGPITTICGRKLGEFWSKGRQRLGSQVYYLTRVYTIDANHDGITDNIGFELRLGASVRTILYRSPSGSLPGQIIKTEEPFDAAMIPRICFGSLVFKVPTKEEVEKEPGEGVFKVPDLAQEMRIRQGKATPEDVKELGAATAKPGTETETSPGSIWIIAGSAASLLAILGAVAFLTRRKWLPKKRKKGKKDGDDDEDEDEDADADADDEEDKDGNGSKSRSKKGLAGFFSRFGKKKRGRDKNDDDEDDDDGGKSITPSRT